MDPAAATAIDALLATPELRRRRVVGVWLFGSFARGESTPDSDVDIAVLCVPPLGIDRPSAIEHATGDRDADVIDLAEASPALAWEIITTGQLVVERDEVGVENFVRNARYAAEDARRRDRMILLATAGTVGGATR